MGRTLRTIRADIDASRDEAGKIGVEIRNAEWVRDWPRADAAREKLAGVGNRLNALTRELKAHPNWKG